MSVNTLLRMNKLFKRPEHPFNMANDGLTTYAEWQYEQGEVTIENYLRFATKEEMFKDKVVLDIGCGAGGKTMYYAKLGVERIVGLDILEKYRADSQELAKKLGVEDKFEFVCADSANTGFAENTFDTVIMNDAMEHVDDPGGTLKEVYRILKPKGRLYVNFPPYSHPYGAHVQDVIGIPYVQKLFSEQTMIDAYKELVKDKPDAAERLEFRFSVGEDGKEHNSYCNKMSIKWFNNLLKENNYNKLYYYEQPIRKYVTPLARIPGVKEFFTRMVVAVLEKK